MNLVVSLLVTSPEPRVIDALESLLPSDGRPAFSDEVNPDWVDVYQVIELIMPPTTLKRHADHLFVEWYETNYSETTYRKALENAGATVRLVHTVGDPAAADDDSGEDSFEGYCYLRVGDELKILNAQNMATLLPSSGLQWDEDIKQNVQQLVTYLVANP